MTSQLASNEQLEHSLLSICIESWRFSRLFLRLISELEYGQGGRYFNQLRYFQKKLEDDLQACGLKLVNLEGQIYDPGIAAQALNLEDFGPDEALIVDQMLEPVVMGPSGVRKQGAVLLKRSV
jgi:hypothetical protein